jgi:aspartate/methionine/tyrosine aminotransferase
MRASGTPFDDLTESNPTRVGLPYEPSLLEPLSDARALTYAPHPFGLESARRQLAAHLAHDGVAPDPEHIVLTASTSEAYAWLFKLLCDPGDCVLVPRPSYPLFEHLTRLEGIRAEPYDLEYHGRWEVNIASVRAAPNDTRAVLVVSPNNPTGSYVSAREYTALDRLCHERGWTLVADEVFAAYPLDAVQPFTNLAARAEALTFSLGGLSKFAGLPQLKLAWLVAGGGSDRRAQALSALELIADSYLSVSTPVQVGLPRLLDASAPVRAAIQQRTRRNLRVLREIASRHPACEVLPVEGGWSAVIRVPATRAEEALVLDLLRSERVLVHPGYFFDFPREAFLVLSLLPADELFASAAERVLRFASC